MGPPSLSSLVAIVNLDGTLRWARCFDGDPSPRLVGDPPGRILLGLTTYAPDDGTMSTHYRFVSLSTGLDDGTASIDAFSDHHAMRLSNTKLLLMSSDTDAGPDLRAYDMNSDRVIGLEAPEAVLAANPNATVSVDPVGDPAVTLGNVIKAIYRGGKWISDAATIDRRVPPHVEVGPVGVTGISASGATLWSNDDLVAPPYEMKFVAADATTTALSGCGEMTDDGCQSPVLDGYVTATGERLWSSPGLRWVFGAADGYVLTMDPMRMSSDTSDDPPAVDQIIVDLRTGAEVQRFAGTPFAAGCCADDIDWTAIVAGAVITQATNTLSVWLPAALTPTKTATISLP